MSENCLYNGFYWGDYRGKTVVIANVYGGPGNEVHRPVDDDDMASIAYQVWISQNPDPAPLIPVLEPEPEQPVEAAPIPEASDEKA